MGLAVRNGGPCVVPIHKIFFASISPQLRQLRLKSFPAVFTYAPCGFLLLVDVPEDFVAKKERQLAEARKRKVRMSARAAQIHKENQAWEINRMLRSGVVERIAPGANGPADASGASTNTEEVDEDFDEEGEARVHLLVKNIVPPFLDGRIIFTKHPDPVMPVKVGPDISFTFYKTITCASSLLLVTLGNLLKKWQAGRKLPFHVALCGC